MGVGRGALFGVAGSQPQKHCLGPGEAQGLSDELGGTEPAGHQPQMAAPAVTREISTEHLADYAREAEEDPKGRQLWSPMRQTLLEELEENSPWAPSGMRVVPATAQQAEPQAFAPCPAPPARTLPQGPTPRLG